MARSFLSKVLYSLTGALVVPPVAIWIGCAWADLLGQIMPAPAAAFCGILLAVAILVLALIQILYYWDDKL